MMPASSSATRRRGVRLTTGFLDGMTQTTSSTSELLLEPVATSEPLPDRLGAKMFVLGFVMLWAYLSAAFLFDVTFRGVRHGPFHFAFALAAGCALIVRMSRARLVTAVIPRASMFGLGLASVGLTLTFLLADLALAVRDNIANERAQELIASGDRTSDPTIWHGELYPRQYAPTNRN